MGKHRTIRSRGNPQARNLFGINSERVPLWRPGAPAWMRLQGPNQWPRSLPELRPALLGWQAAMTKVAVRLLRALAEALGQSPDFFEPIYRDAPNQHVKIIRYPGSDAAANGQGVGAHNARRSEAAPGTLIAMMGQLLSPQ